MAEAIMSFAVAKPHIGSSCFRTNKPELNLLSKSARQCSTSRFSDGCVQQSEFGGMKKKSSTTKRGCLSKVKAFPDWPLMSMIVEHMEGQRDLITQKSIWHLSDTDIKKVYTFYVMFTGWGCCVFGSTKDPYYDSEGYRKDGGDGTGNWIYEKQDNIEERNRAELWREELIEEIEQKVGGLRELEEAKEEELLTQ